MKKDPNLPSIPEVRQFMQPRVFTLTPNMDIHDAIAQLWRRGYSGAPVIDENRQVLGVLSEFDALKVVADTTFERAPEGTVADHMTKEVETIAPSADIYGAIAKFVHGKMRRLPVVDPERGLVGILSRRDLMHALDEAAQPEARRRKSTYDLIAERS
jgi:CBS domain-containing protein